MAGPQQQPSSTVQQQPPPPSTGAAVVGGLVAAQIAGLLAAAIVPTATYESLIQLLHLKDKTEEKALETVLHTLEKYQLPKMEGLGAAQRYVIQLNEQRRAAYVPTAVARVTRQLKQYSAQGLTNEQAVRQVNAQENRYFGQHIQAAQQRVLAASKIDGLRYRYGDVLGWYARMDSDKTTPECRAANGKNFSALKPPKIGWPGLVHVNCRCEPGKPFRDGKMLR